MSSLRQRKGRKYLFALAVIVGINLAFGVSAVFQYPLFDMADELFHFDYVYRFSEGKGLINIYEDPIQDKVFDLAVDVGHWRKEGLPTPPEKGVVTPEFTESIQRWGWYPSDITGGSSYEGVQPPLYYAVAGSFAKLVEPMAWKAYAARLVTLMFSILAGLATYFLMLRISGKQFVALGTMLFLTVLPAWRFESFRINNGMASIFLILASVLLFFYLKDRQSETNLQWVLILAVVVGVASLSRLNAALVIFPVLFACYAVLSKESLSLKIRSYALILAVTAGFAGWFYIRNLLLYGDPSGGYAIINAIYIDPDLDVAPNIFAAFAAIFRFASFFVFSPSLQMYDQNILLAAGYLWLTALAISLSRVVFDVHPPLRSRAEFILPLVFVAVWVFISGASNYYLLLLVIPLYIMSVPRKNVQRVKPHQISEISLLFYFSIVPVGIAAAYFLTFIGPISERYLLAAAPFGVGFLLYSIQSCLHPSTRKIYLIGICFLIIFAGITHQFNQIAWLLQNLAS